MVQSNNKEEKTSDNELNTTEVFERKKNKTSDNTVSTTLSQQRSVHFYQKPRIMRFIVRFEREKSAVYSFTQNLG